MQLDIQWVIEQNRAALGSTIYDTDFNHQPKKRTTMRNETLRAKIKGNIAALTKKMQPIQDELELQTALLEQLDAAELKKASAAAVVIGIDLAKEAESA